MDKFMPSKEEFMLALSNLADTHGMPPERQHSLSTMGYLSQGLGELFDHASYSSYISTREMFPATAQFKDSLYKWNKISDAKIQTAYSSSRLFQLEMSMDELLKYATAISPDVYRYTIPTDAKIEVDGFIYSFDYPVQIQIYDPNDKASVTARYDMENNYNPISSVTNPNIKAIKQNRTIIISLEVFQYERVISTMRYIDSSTDKMTVDYENQVQDFVVYYRENEFAETAKRLKKSMYFQQGIPDEPTIYYELGDKTITLVHKGYRGNFIPARDSSIEIVMYITRGAEGNFEYIGENIKLLDPEEEELPFNISVTTGENYIAEGLSEDDIDSIRKKTLDNIHTRNSIITENDLNIHYSQKGKNYKVVKTRDDCLKRVYSVYAPIKTPKDYYVPTNTMDIQIDLTKLDSPVDGYYKIPENAHFRTNSAGAVAYMRDVAESGDIFDYVSSLGLSVNHTARVIEAYELVVNRKNVLTEYTYNYDKSQYSFMINRVNLSREVNGKFKFKFDVMTNLDGEVIKFHTDQPDGSIQDTGQLVVDLVFESQEGVFLGYVKAVMKAYDEKGDAYTFEAEVNTDFFIRNSKINLDLLDSTGSSITIDSPIELFALRILARDNSTQPSDVVSTDYGVPVISGKEVINVFSLFNYTLVKSYTDVAGLHLRDVSATEIQITYVSLFGYKFIEQNGYTAYDDTYTEMDNINSLYLQTQTNFVNNFKFANTYGPSKIHRIGNGTTALDRVDITMGFRIGLAYNSEVDLDYVRDKIRGYFDEVNFLKDETFHISTVIQKLKDEVIDVQKVEFTGINGFNSDYQYLYSLYNVDDPNIIPEIVNIRYDVDGNYLINLTKIS